MVKLPIAEYQNYGAVVSRSGLILDTIKKNNCRMNVLNTAFSITTDQSERKFKMIICQGISLIKVLAQGNEIK